MNASTTYRDYHIHDASRLSAGLLFVSPLTAPDLHIYETKSMDDAVRFIDELYGDYLAPEPEYEPTETLAYVVLDHGQSTTYGRVDKIRRVLLDDVLYFEGEYDGVKVYRFADSGTWRQA